MTGLMAGVFLFSSLTAQAASEHHYSYFVDTDSITIYDTNLQGLNDREPGQVDFEESVTKLVDEADPVAAKKYAYYDDESIADGFIKIDIDFASADKYREAIDVLFVLDQSGSMNMMSNNELSQDTDAGSTTSKYTSPCLNTEHYYRVPVQANVDGTQTAFWYYFQPYSVSAVNTWDDSAFINGIKASFKEDLKNLPGYENSTITVGYLNHQNVPEYASNLDYLRMDFDSEHYEKIADGPVIYSAKEDNADQQAAVFKKLNNKAQTVRYYSPGENDNGCNDRMGYSRTAVAGLAQQVLNAYPGSRVGLVTFNGSVQDSCPLDTYPDGLPAGFADTTGGDYTSYINALAEAKKLLQEASTTDGRQRYVLFVTDGMTTDKNDSEIQKLAGEVRGLADLHCVGISLSSNAFAYIQGLATEKDGKKLATNAATMDDFADILRSFYDEIDIQAPVITDIVGNAFELYCDEEHPLRFTWLDSAGQTQTQTFGSLEAAAAQGVTYYSDKNELTWDTDKYDSHAVRLSFYQKLLPEVIGQNTGESYVYATNESATISYTDTDNTEKETPILTPAQLTVDQSVLTAVLSCDVPDGSTVKTGDTLEYTITLTNRGDVDLTDVVVYDPLPAGTAFLSCDSNGALRANGSGVDFTLGSLKAGETAAVSFKVTVTAKGPATITDTAFFGLTDAEKSFDGNGDPVCICGEISHNLVASNDEGQDVTPDKPTDDNQKPSDGGTSDNGTLENGTTGGGTSADVTAVSKTAVPRTGDTNGLTMWLLLILLSAAGAVAAQIKRRQRLH